MLTPGLFQEAVARRYKKVYGLSDEELEKLGLGPASPEPPSMFFLAKPPRYRTTKDLEVVASWYLKGGTRRYLIDEPQEADGLRALARYRRTCAGLAVLYTVDLLPDGHYRVLDCPYDTLTDLEKDQIKEAITNDREGY